MSAREGQALLSAADFAWLTGGLSVRTVRAWAAAGRIASCKLGSRVMIPSSEVERVVKETQRSATRPLCTAVITDQEHAA
jgi:excisionase family DNA binding protein